MIQEMAFEINKTNCYAVDANPIRAIETLLMSRSNVRIFIYNKKVKYVYRVLLIKLG